MVMKCCSLSNIKNGDHIQGVRKKHVFTEPPPVKKVPLTILAAPFLVLGSKFEKDVVAVEDLDGELDLRK